MTDLEYIVVCWNQDKLKLNGVYVPLDKAVMDDYIKKAEELGIKISHGICPECMTKAIDELDYQFIKVSKRPLWIILGISVITVIIVRA